MTTTSGRAAITRAAGVADRRGRRCAGCVRGKIAQQTGDLFNGLVEQAKIQPE